MAKKQIELSSLQPVANSVIATDIPDYMIKSYYQYVSYIASGRIACNVLDGFKNIHRRILYAANEVCKNNNIKSVTLQGTTTGKFSPHGDCYSSIVGLVNNGLLKGKGNFGNLYGVEIAPPAAQRYTEVRMNPLTECLFMNKDLMPYVDYVESENSTNEKKFMEPVFLPVLLPGIYTGISDSCEFDSGMAWKLSIKYPRFAVISLLNYVINYLKTGQFNPNLLYYQYHNVVKQCTNDIDSKQAIEFKCVATQDNNGEVHLLSTLPFVQMEKLMSNIAYEDHTTGKTDIVIEKKDYTDKFKTTAKFNMKAYRVINGDYENVILYDYPIRYAIQVILSNLKNCLFPRYFTDKIKKIDEQIAEQELLKAVRTKYVDHKIPFDQMTEDEQKCAGRHSSAKFMTIEKTIASLQQDRIILVNRSKNIDKEIMDLYEDALAKTTKYMQSYWKEKNVQMYDITNI